MIDASDGASGDGAVRNGTDGERTAHDITADVGAARNIAAREQTLRAALNGRRIIVTRPGTQGETFAKRLQELGATPVVIPVIAIAPPLDTVALDVALNNITTFEWIAFASANAVKAIADRLTALGITRAARWPKLAAIGAPTAAALSSLGWDVAFEPQRNSGDALARELPIAHGSRVLLPRAAEGLPALAAGLRERGADVSEVVAYCTVPHPDTAASFAALASHAVDAVTFTSPSTVVQFMLASSHAGWSAVTVQHRRDLKVVCIGNTTAQTAVNQGLQLSAIATQQSQEGLIDALASCFAPAAT